MCSVADTDLYAMLFTPIRQQVLNVTEIGVAAGQSLQMWHDFFPRAQLWGLDLKSGACFERCPSKFAGHPRVHLRWGNSCKKPHVDRLGFARESMDLVLDDGDHFPLSNEITLVHFWPFVKKGGYYVIEDVATGARQATGRYGCRAALRGSPERCGFAPGGFAQLVHNRTSLGAEARAIMEEADTRHGAGGHAAGPPQPGCLPREDGGDVDAGSGRSQLAPGGAAQAHRGAEGP